MINKERESVAEISSSIRMRAMREDLLSREKEYELALIIKKNPDSSEGFRAVTELVMSHQKLLLGMARSFQTQGVALEDLYQAGSIGLIKAAQAFDPDQGNRFNTFAQWKVLSHMQDLVADSSTTVRVGKGRKEKMIARLLRQAALISENGITQAHMEAISERCEVSLREVESIAEASLGRGISLNHPMGSGDGEKEMELIDMIADNGESVDKLHSVSMENAMSRVVEDLLGVLTPRERIVIEGRFLRDDPLTLRELGEDLDVSPERIRQIVREALVSLESAMRSRGYKAQDVLPDLFGS